jgi:hypothetical protein
MGVAVSTIALEKEIAFKIDELGPRVALDHYIAI